MNLLRLFKVATVMLITVFFVIGNLAQAQQDYPSKAITLLIPYPAGSGNDLVGRIVGNKLSSYLGQRVVSDNRSGASGNIAIEAVHRALADGHTLVVASVSFSINQFTMKLNYDPKDFTAVALLGKLPFTLVATKPLPVKNLKEMINFLKQKPNQFNAGQSGPTGTSFFLLESLKKISGIDVTSVGYKGSTEGIIDILGERTHMMFVPLTTSMPYYRSDRVNLMGVTGSNRTTLLPLVPTFTEQGYPELDIPTWFGLMGPPGIATNTIRILNQAIEKTLNSKEVIAALQLQGIEPTYGSSEELKTFIKADSALWGKLIKDSGIKSF